MNSCSQCGSPIPSGQSVCSMCYGDIDFGKDGYYRQWAEQEEKRNIELQQEHLLDHPDYLEAMNEQADIDRQNAKLDEQEFNKQNPADDLPF